jgi:predicted ferric reductase
MNEVSINTPALLFPAISLIMLAYTNRFFAIANRVRTLHEEFAKATNKEIIKKQIQNLRRRLNLIRYMQTLAVISFLCCMVCMYFIYKNYQGTHILFAASLICMILSLAISLQEIFISTNAIELELSDMEDLDKNSLMDIFKRE